MRRRETATHKCVAPGRSEESHLPRRGRAMRRLRHSLSRRRLLCIALLLAGVFIWLVVVPRVSVYLTLRKTLSPEQIRTNTRLAQSLMQNLSSMAVPLCMVTDGPAACAAWRWALSADGSVGPTQTPYTVVVGGLTTDTVRGARIRPRSGRTWMTDPNVARRANNFEGRMLVVFVLAEHHTRPGRGPSDALRREAEAAANILWIQNVGDPPLCQVEDGEECGIGRKRGFAPEFAMSRKVAAWYAYARLQFPRAPYIGKMDDDAYIRPQVVFRHLEHLATLTHPIVVTPDHLKMLSWGFLFRTPTMAFPFGWLYLYGATAVDVMFRNDPTMMSALLGPPDRRLLKMYHDNLLLPEDAMVGHFFSLYANQNKAFYVKFDDCFLHNIARGPGGQPITSNSFCIHRIFPEEVESLHQRMMGESAEISPKYQRWNIGFGEGLLVTCQ